MKTATSCAKSNEDYKNSLKKLNELYNKLQKEMVDNIVLASKRVSNES